MNEDLFVRHLTQLFPAGKDVVTGIGDDAAVLDLAMPDGMLFLAAADQVIRDIHFTAETALAAAGGKLVNRNISDIAAMGGIPTHAILTAAAKPFEENTLKDFHEGVARAAARYDVAIIGGDLAALPSPGFAATLSIFGKVEKEKLCLRANAKPGDWIYCTGEYGNSFHSGHHLTFQPRLAEARFLAGTYTRAMMDVCDSLFQTVRSMAEASGLAAELAVDMIPLREGATSAGALWDGEDYELVFAVSQENAGALEKAWQFTGVQLTRIGQFISGTAGTVNGDFPETDKAGYDHFHETD